ncbi:MAG TPA: XrtA/PEP-CTERM system-associated ATPase [Vicinamibacterales bacterium]|jgi:putative secretion ATPase (PEP-CTERM system associated)|nr:XrtA/PEP-CTERM system-associated ATPase [Vicinamibacterales bacterium]
MYERFYNLRERPFSLTPDPDCLYLSRVHREGLSYLRYGIEGRASFVVITGEIGSGKTTLLQTVLRGLDRQTSVSRIVNTMLDARELIEAVMLDFGLEPAAGRSKPALLHDLARFLVDQRIAGRLALLVVDEAQNLSMAALEEIRMLSNLETEKSKLLQVVLIGQPNLRHLLARPELEQLRQRVTVSYHLMPIDADDAAAYINHRLRRVAIGAPLEFGRDVTDLIHEHSQGIPRKINVICDAVLLFGYGEDRRVIDVDLTLQVLEELRTTGVIQASPDGAQPLAGSPAPIAAPGWVPALAPAPAPEGLATLRSSALDSQALIAQAAAIAVRERDLAQREAQLAERERQLIEQRRVLAEELELMRRIPDTRQPAAAGEAKVAWPPPAKTVTPEGLWTRLRRSVFGPVKPVFED